MLPQLLRWSLFRFIGGNSFFMLIALEWGSLLYATYMFTQADSTLSRILAMITMGIVGGVMLQRGLARITFKVALP